MTEADARWETLHADDCFILKRWSRFLVAELMGEHLTLSTSVRNGGQTRSVRYLVNHQSCEATMHKERYDLLHAMGQDAYHDVVCGEIELPETEIVLMGTAANMNYAAVVVVADEALKVTAVVTAGVQGNASCAGDPAAWREGEAGWQKVNGTINTMVLINRPVTEAALARCVVTMTEAKSTALQRLAVQSLYSEDLATGTGTDQFAIAAPAHGPKPLTSASTHVKLGELIGRAVRDATLEALRWQNGLEPSYGRSIFSALGRFGLKEEALLEQIASLLSADDLELLRRNSKAVFFEPLVAASAYALASVLDRIRYGTIPASASHEAVRQQCASVGVSLSGKPQLWEWFRSQLTREQPMDLFQDALAQGWAAKWKP